ncbi:MAG: PEP-CTERM sorting domain-containing protein [Massilia sp.]|nr:PEP-CTERM sorting domain-containing protein [Massilia sp.]
MRIAKKMIVLTIGLAASSHHAQAAPIFTLSSFTFGASTGETLTGAALASRSIAVAAFDSVSKSAPTYTTVVTLAPTTTTAGIATTYEKYTTTTTHTDTSYTDTASYRVQNSTADTTRNQQLIRLIGMVTAHVATTLTFQLIAEGAYTMAPNGRRDVELPREASLWFNRGPTAASVSDFKTDVQLNSSRSIPVEFMYVQSSNLQSITMTPGQQLYVAAELDTTTNLSMSNFAINFTSAVYGGAVNAPTTANVNKMLFTSTISPIPEPGTNTMVVAGLALMGMLVRRRKTPA